MFLFCDNQNSCWAINIFTNGPLGVDCILCIIYVWGLRPADLPLEHQNIRTSCIMRHIHNHFNLSVCCHLTFFMLSAYLFRTCSDVEVTHCLLYPGQVCRGWWHSAVQPTKYPSPHPPTVAATHPRAFFSFFCSTVELQHGRLWGRVHIKGSF